MRKTSILVSAAAAAVAMAGSALATNGMTRIPLPGADSDGGNQLQHGTLSDDGQVLAGRDGNGYSLLWTASGGAQSVPVAYANGISGDGQVAFGTDGASQAVRWSRSSQSSDSLGYLPATYPGSFAFAASTNGSVIAGASFTDSGTRAFRWTSSGGMQNLGLLEDPGTGYRASEAYGVSGDGSVIAGYSTIGTEGASRAFRWTASGGMQNLGTLSGDAYSWANGVSKDGSTVIGRSTSSDGLSRAMRWTAGSGMEALGALAAGLGSDAVSSSADGSLIVGSADVSGGSHAFIWSAAMGMSDLNSYLTLNGLDLGGVTLTNALAISADGSTILANGYSVMTIEDPDFGPYDVNVNGSYLITIPAPGALALLGVAGLAGSRRRR